VNDTGTSNLPQLKAFRGWLSAIHAMVGEVGHTIDDQIEYHEGEIKRLKGRRERTKSVLESMELALKTVDENLTRVQQKTAEDTPAATAAARKAATAAPRKTSAPRRSAASAAKRPQARGEDEEIVTEEVSE
jgi:acyl-CoA reductase-like NAD-dependent aldehyde dehydrogenase